MALALSLSVRASSAAPQANVGMTFGGVAEDVTTGPPHGQVHWGGRADVLFLRSRGSDMALGPYVDAGTSSFHDFDAGGGLSWLLPVRDDLPFVLSAGFFTRTGEGWNWAPGAEGTLFWGSRSYNFHSWYGIALGLFAEAKYLPGSREQTEQTDLVFGIHMDGEVMLMPSMLILQLLGHSNDNR
jgi:hypothetical protein